MERYFWCCKFRLGSRLFMLPQPSARDGCVPRPLSMLEARSRIKATIWQSNGMRRTGGGGQEEGSGWCETDQDLRESAQCARPGE